MTGRGTHWKMGLGAWLWLSTAAMASDAVTSEVLHAEESPYHGEAVYMVMNKSTNDLSVRSLEKPNVIFKKYRAISGTNPGDKIKEGDKKTPEGIYFIEGQIPAARMQKLHGAAAFATNYPNPVDKIFKRTGSGIWVHGVETEERMQKRFDTLGCVALGNQDVVDLKHFLRMRETPIVIVDQDTPAQPIGLLSNDGPLAKRIYAWLGAWSSRDADQYLSYYSADFQGRGMSMQAWRAYKKRLVGLYKEINVRIRNLKILRHGKYSVAIFEQNYKSNLYQSIGKKRLYLMGEGETAQIISEESLMARQGRVGSFPDDWDNSSPGTNESHLQPISSENPRGQDQAQGQAPVKAEKAL